MCTVVIKAFVQRHRSSSAVDISAQDDIFFGALKMQDLKMQDRL